MANQISSYRLLPPPVLNTHLPPMKNSNLFDLALFRLVASLGRSSMHRAAVALLTAALACVTAPTFAQGSYPNRPVKLVVAFPPGGAVDVIARDIATGLSALWGQPVVVDNKPGGGGVIGVDAVAKAAPDGYTLMLAYDGVTVLPFLQDKLPYDILTDLKPIALVGNMPMILVTAPAFNVKTVPEFIAAAKAKPGVIDYATNGIGSSTHFTMESFQRAAGIKLKHIPYKGNAPAMQDMLGGRIPVMWAAVSSALPLVQSGKLVPVAVGSLERSALLPQVPTVSESGLPGFEGVSWLGVMGPAKIPEAIVQKIHTDLQTVIQTAAYREMQAKRGNEVRRGSSAEFSKLIRADYDSHKAAFERGEMPRE